MKSENHYAKILRVVLKNDVVMKKDWNGTLQEFVGALGGRNVADSGERRHSQRQPVRLEAVIRIQKRNNEVVYLPAIMKNISGSGVMLEIQDKGHIIVGSLNDIEQFLVSFVVPGQANPVMVECFPRRLEINELVGVGAEFAELDSEPHKYVM